ncbi:MMPL family transporter [Paractinoplanes atraurantiacus]|uniref:Putative drug exporter of the RND superfamily n=1 Tax=Paractinoplanes atraurantiacus TaxID=1036182 RepID=A0A285HNK9_9ACTN|nr:MMPL family transporter [Actinoplanes atraurantiacus]SNY37320.1 putative drug exporter of the RND superfamily [Actinoplanes atraurantiacus]
MTSLARACYRGRFAVLGGWIAALLVLAGLVLALGTAFTDDAGMPDSESGKAYSLLGSSSSATESGTIAWHTENTSITSVSVRREFGTLLDEIAGWPGVKEVVSPYEKAGAAQLNADGDAAYAQVVLTENADTAAIEKAAIALRGAGVDVQVGGQAFTEQPGGSHGGEAVGLIAALVILFLVFRSAWAAALPIITGVVGVATSLLVVILAAHVVDLAATSLTMGALIGLGVGIDYALFIVNRYRKSLMAGDDVPGAIARALNTSGRAVIFAGLTVIVALLGMYVVQLGILTGMAQAAAVTVLFTVAAAITLLPALLGMLGHRVLSRKQRAALTSGPHHATPDLPAPHHATPDLPAPHIAMPDVSAPHHAMPDVSATHHGAPDLSGSLHGVSTASRWLHGAPAATPATRLRIGDRWAAFVQRAPLRAGAGALLIVLVLASPVLKLRVGDADASSDPAGSSSRAYYELMADGFGAGFDASLLLVAEIPDAASAQEFAALVKRLPAVENVASVSSRVSGGVAVATVVPRTNAQSEQTSDLVKRLRDDVVPASGLQVYVGGATASSIDLAAALMSKLPLYLGLIALLGFLLLAVAFRSLVVPLAGAISNLATIFVGLGAVTAIFQFGWGTELLGVGEGAPVTYLIPVLIMGIMFGLSMDYQVFLVSRMHEEWSHTKDNRSAVRVGLRETAQVIAAAATIMLFVFASFGFSGERIVSMIGVGLAIAVVVDAFVVRMTLIPALMTLLGRANWFYPRGLDKITPKVSVEGPAERAAKLGAVPAPARESSFAVRDH